MSPHDAAMRADPFEIRAQRALKLCVPLLVIGAMVEFAVGSSRPLRAAEAVSAAPVWQLTYLKAHRGASVDSLARVVTANWFAMDAQAVAAGDLASYHLVRGTGTDSTWDLLEIAVFRDSAQHARADSLYRTKYRPAHRVVLVGGKELAGWGRIVRSEAVRHVAGAP